MSYEIDTLVLTEFASNCYVLHETGGNALIIDPGGEAEFIQEHLARKHLSLKMILNTHGHLDHATANAPLVQATGATVAIHSADAAMLSDPVLNGSALFGWPFTPCTPDIVFEEGQQVGAGSMMFEVVHTPGHTRGSCSFLDRTGGNLFCGDFVMCGGIGRVDLPCSDPRAMMESIKSRFLVLPDDIRVWPGHGEPTTVGLERRTNPYFSMQL